MIGRSIYVSHWNGAWKSVEEKVMLMGELGVHEDAFGSAVEESRNVDFVSGMVSNQCSAQND